MRARIPQLGQGPQPTSNARFRIAAIDCLLINRNAQKTVCGSVPTGNRGRVAGLTESSVEMAFIACQSATPRTLMDKSELQRTDDPPQF